MSKILQLRECALWNYVFRLVHANVNARNNNDNLFVPNRCENTSTPEQMHSRWKEGGIEISKLTKTQLNEGTKTYIIEMLFICQVLWPTMRVKVEKVSVRATCCMNCYTILIQYFSFHIYIFCNPTHNAFTHTYLTLRLIH